MKKIISLFLCLLCSTLIVSANSGPASWEGKDASGTILIDEDCPIEVTHEKLTFSLTEFPSLFYDSLEEYLTYQATVQAEYTLLNPTDMSITAHLLFPIGSSYHYFGYYDEQGNYNFSHPQAPSHTILLNQQPVDYQVRYTQVNSEPFDFQLESSNLSDAFKEDDFFSLDLLVTRQIYQVNAVDYTLYQAALAAFEIPASHNSTVFVFNEMNAYHINDKTMSAGLFLDAQSEVEILLIGEPMELDWTIFVNGGMKEVIDGHLSLISSETMTFEELVMSTYDQDSDILTHDWYNLILDSLNADVPFYDISSLHPDLDSLMKWYDYSIEIAPHSSAVHTVSAPVYPEIHLRYEPDLYTYTYLLSPAQSWKSFQNLDIEILTPFHLIDSSLSGFEKTEKGYQLHVTELPEEELVFQLSSSDSPSISSSFHMYQMTHFILTLLHLLIPAAAVILLILFFAKSRIER